MSVSRFVAVYHDDVLVVHAKPPSGAYISLCAVDGDDDKVGQAPAKLPPNPKITCGDCKAIIRQGRLYKDRDFGETVL